MANEKSVRGGAPAGDGTDTANRYCDDCLGEPRLDPVSRSVVRHLRSARLLLDASIDHLDSVTGKEYLRQRQYPAPEVREIRRKVVTAISMIDEIGGDL